MSYHLVIFYPDETNPERIKRPANYSLPRLLLKIKEAYKTRVIIIYKGNKIYFDNNLIFIPFSWVSIAILSIFVLIERSIVISQEKIWDKWAFYFAKYTFSKFVLRRGGVYFGKETICSKDFITKNKSSLKIIENCDHFITTADGTPVNLFREIANIPINKFSALVNGFPYNNMPLIKKRNDQLLCVSRLSPEKGIDYVIKSFADVHAKIPNYHLTILGDGPSKPELINLCKHFGISDKVFFYGHSNNVFKFLSEAKLLIAGLSNNIIIESIVARIPVIALELGEFQMLYGHFPNVYIINYNKGGYGEIPERNLKQLIKDTSDTILKVINNYDSLDLNYVIDYKKFGWETRIENEMKIYDRLINK